MPTVSRSKLIPIPKSGSIVNTGCVKLFNMPHRGFTQSWIPKQTAKQFYAAGDFQAEFGKRSGLAVNSDVNEHVSIIKWSNLEIVTTT